MTTDAVALQVDHLCVEIAGGSGDILTGVSLTIPRGQILGLVGESGSGKTTLALSVFGHSRRGTHIRSGRVTIAGNDILSLPPKDLTAARGRLVAYVPQDPATALNPGMRIGSLLLEAIHAVGITPRDEDQRRVAELLSDVGLPTDRSFIRRYPHQLSGGQMQRVTIALALAGNPPLLVMDEPTTGLDVTTQARILDLVRKLAQTHDTAILYVTHDLAVVGELATDLAVMYAGRVVEQGPAVEVLARPSHPYTQGLVAAAPELRGRTTLAGMPGSAPDPRSRGRGCAFAPRCPWVMDLCKAQSPPLASLPAEPARLVACLRAGEVVRHPAASPAAPSLRPTSPDGNVLEVTDVAAGYGGEPVLRGVSLVVARRQCVAVVGESGSGKTTLVRTIAGMHREASGTITLEGQELRGDARERPRHVRREIQYIFQNPYASLNPRRTIEKCLAQPLRLFDRMSSGEVRDRVRSVLEHVELPPTILSSYPDQLSGGQRQRVAIARALIVEPTLLICDEITSALDVSIQAVVVQMLLRLRTQYGLSMLFVTHNLGLASSMADGIVVLRQGTVVESGFASTVLSQPSHEYTRSLLRDTPTLYNGESPPANAGRSSNPGESETQPHRG